MMRSIMKIKILYSFCMIYVFTFLFIGTVGFCIEPKNIDMYFWPTAVTNNYDSESYLYGWPNFKVLLQTKNDKGNYYPAEIDEHISNQMNLIFRQEVDSPIRIFRDNISGHWGLYIPGGSALSINNIQLLRLMVDKLLACMRSLSQEEFNRLSRVFYSPGSYISPAGSIDIDKPQQMVAAKLFEKIKSNTCSEETGVIPDLFEKRISAYFAQLLTGKNEQITVTDGELLVVTTLFRDILFSPHGLWVKAALAKIKEHINNQMEQYPIHKDKTWFGQNYQSFIDFVLLTKNHHRLSKNQYLDVAKVCGINSLIKVFDSCNLLDLIEEEKIITLTLEIGLKKSMHIFKREKK
jgi:hypothetical protein